MGHIEGKLRLYDFAGSPFCIKVRAILDYKGLAYERMNVASPRIVELRRRSPTKKVPALEIDGRLVTDSTEIAHALDEFAPEPRLLPADPRLAADNHLLEDWADEALYFLGIYYRWQHREGRKEAATIFPAAVAPLIGAAVGREARRQLRAQGVGRKSEEQVARDLERALATLDVRLGDGPHLLGEVPYLCDFAVMGQLVYLVRTPAGRRAIEAHPAITAFLERMRALRATSRAA